MKKRRKFEITVKVPAERLTDEQKEALRRAFQIAAEIVIPMNKDEGVSVSDVESGVDG